MLFHARPENMYSLKWLLNQHRLVIHTKKNGVSVKNTSHTWCEWMNWRGLGIKNTKANMREMVYLLKLQWGGRLVFRKVGEDEHCYGNMWWVGWLCLLRLHLYHDCITTRQILWSPTLNNLYLSNTTSSFKMNSHTTHPPVALFTEITGNQSSRLGDF